MLAITWLSAQSIFIHETEDVPPKIVGCRHACHDDLEDLERLHRVKTHELFGEADIRQIFEKCCLTVVQYNEKDEIVSGICLCNYPNVPAIPCYDWLSWIRKHYEVTDIDEKTTLFVHYLVWDYRYNDSFFDGLLTATYDLTTFCIYVMLILPPLVVPDKAFEQQMIKLFPKDIKNVQKVQTENGSYKVQTLYKSVRYDKAPKLKIRRVVEEDNDDIIPIIDAEAPRLKELYGEYYISELIRHPDSNRQLIVSEGDDGMVTGVMCLNCMIDVDTLTEHFELTPYHGLRKPHPDDQIPLEHRAISEILYSVFRGLSQESLELSSVEEEEEPDEEEEALTDYDSSMDDKIFSPIIIEQKIISTKELFEIDPPPKPPSASIVSFKLDDSSRKGIFQKDRTDSKARHVSIETISASKAVGTKSSKVIKEMKSPVPFSSTSSSVTDIDKKYPKLFPEQSEKSEKSENHKKSEDTSSTTVSGTSAASVTDHLTYYQAASLRSKMRMSIFGDTVFMLPHTFLDTKEASYSPEMRASMPSQMIDDSLLHPVYHGEVNAFALEILAFRDAIQERWACDYLEAAFDCFPDLDYCVMLTPFTQPSFPFVEQFLNVPLRCNKDFSMALNLSHKAILLGKIKSREARRRDRDAVVNLLETIPKSEAILAKFDEIVPKRKRNTNCYIFQCNQILIGLVILCQEEDPDAIKAGYNVEDYISVQNVPRNGYGRILHFVLMPIFSIYYRFFIREITRLNGEYIVLYYRIYEEDVSALTRTQPLATCLYTMILVNPRRQIDYRFHTPTYVGIDCRCHMKEGSIVSSESGESGVDENEDEDRENEETRDDKEKSVETSQSEEDKETAKTEHKHSIKMLDKEEKTEVEQLEEEEEKFTLFMTTPRLAVKTTPIINAKIIIVGASDCGVALAEFLALGFDKENVRFSNVTIISPNGLPFETKRGIEAIMLPFKGRYCRDYKRLVTRRTWINLIYGTVSGINRKHRYVTVLDQGVLIYNYLILTCGFQYQRPVLPEETEAEKRGETVDTSRPWNCLTVNDDVEASVCLKKIKKITNNLTRKKAIVFYGHNIDCYCALHGLLQFGIKGSWITLVEPPLMRCENHESVFFDDLEVDTAVQNGIAENGINVISGWRVVDWILYDTNQGKMIKSLVLESKGDSKRINCDALFNFFEKTINMDIFLAICRAGLVFDGHLVIDPECRTNDPYIFAGGTITKYSRRLYAQPWQHRHHNSIEIGERIGRILRATIEKHQKGSESTEDSSQGNLYNILGALRMPLIFSCTLPGGYHYLHVRNPGVKVKRSIAISHHIYGDVIETGSCTSDIGYFRLRFNTYDCVETITCTSRKKFEMHNFVCLYNKHERMLNNLKLRFNNSCITDLYSYFREPWAAALFHDKFNDFRAENRRTLESRIDAPTNTLIHDCKWAYEKSNWEQMAQEDQEYIEYRFANSIYQRDIEERLLDFLEFAEDDLSMYCTPNRLRRLCSDLNDSPMFTDIY